MTINKSRRYQPGLTLKDIYPSISGYCACGCGQPLTGKKRKWHSEECRDLAFVNFAVIKGDISIIRQQLFEIDNGACRKCGVITDNWEADHILPVSEGGGGCELSNYQTLCSECHKEKTHNLIYYPTVRQFLRRNQQPELNELSLQQDIHQIAV
jgi:5-methylcytosine-specific restriction endonuclease McrA